MGFVALRLIWAGTLKIAGSGPQTFKPETGLDCTWN